MSDKTLIVLGAGESGVGAAILGKQKGYDVFVSDGGVISDDYKKILEDYKIRFESGEHEEQHDARGVRRCHGVDHPQAAALRPRHE